MFAVVAPSISSQITYAKLGQVVSGLKELGFHTVVEAALARNPAARVCISAIALETLSAAVAALTAHGLQAEGCQISVSRAKAAGKLHLLMANNPIFLITGTRK